jgi:hypothetical protein
VRQSAGVPPWDFILSEAAAEKSRYEASAEATGPRQNSPRLDGISLTCRELRPNQRYTKLAELADPSIALTAKVRHRGSVNLSGHR